jgi:hypothetical protein
LARAHRHAHADLMGALGDRDQHDVHHADAADDQRDHGNGIEISKVMVAVVFSTVWRYVSLLKVKKSLRPWRWVRSLMTLCSATWLEITVPDPDRDGVEIGAGRDSRPMAAWNRAARGSRLPAAAEGAFLFPGHTDDPVQGSDCRPGAPCPAGFQSPCKTASLLVFWSITTTWA